LDKSRIAQKRRFLALTATGTPTIPALSDDIVATSDFRNDLRAYLDKVRAGHVITVFTGSNEDSVSVITRQTLAALIEIAKKWEALAAEVEGSELIRDEDAMHALERGENQLKRGRGMSPDEARAKLGRRKKDS
jgi:PHD/YefM family antitoxin component YafN of YafNO toxin-antitoxin module